MPARGRLQRLIGDSGAGIISRAVELNLAFLAVASLDKHMDRACADPVYIRYDKSLEEQKRSDGDDKPPE